MVDSANAMAVNVAVTSRKVIDTVAGNQLFRHVYEIALVAVAFLLYFVVRGSVVDREAEAVANAVEIIDLQRRLGFWWEPDLNAAVLDHHWLIQIFDGIYFWMDFPLIVAIGLWMYFFGFRHQYTVARDALLASGAIALVVYHLYPVAPPRLLPPEYGFVDTLAEYNHLAYQAQSTEFFVNPYAAMPSLHFGWAMLVGGVLFWSTRNWAVRALAIALPVAQFTAILFTANHYILDAMAGAVVGLMGLLVAMALQQWGYPRIQRFAAEPAPASSPAGPPG
jgi:hypothetical protein